MAAPFLNGPTLLWANAEAKTLYFRLKGNIQSGPVAGIMSCYAGDIENYDNTNYRDLLSSTLRAIDGIGTSSYDDVGSTETEDLRTASGNAVAAITTPLLEKTTEAGVQTVVTNTAKMSLDDNVSHTPPRAEKKVRTMLLFYDAATNAGSCVFWAWADELVAFSLAEFEFI